MFTNVFFDLGQITSSTVYSYPNDNAPYNSNEQALGQHTETCNETHFDVCDPGSTDPLAPLDGTGPISDYPCGIMVAGGSDELSRTKIKELFTC